MAFKLTYTDGQETEYDDGTVWEVDDGVLKMGRTEGEWTVLVSPSHWAVIEVGGAAAQRGTDDNASRDDTKESDDDKKSDDKKSDDNGDADTKKEDD